MTKVARHQQVKKTAQPFPPFGTKRTRTVREHIGEHPGRPRTGLGYDASMSTAHTVLDELIDPIGACLTPEVAERLASLRAPESAQARMAELARKSEDGTLSDDERDEYDAFVSASNFIAILQSKARRLLKDLPT